MTEKRFTFVRDDNNKSIGIFDNKYERKCLQWGQIARLLNRLNGENEQLKSKLKSSDVTEKILEWFENVMTPHCPNCNAELDIYAFYDDKGAFRICKNCGEKVRE